MGSAQGVMAKKNTVGHVRSLFSVALYISIHILLFLFIYTFSIMQST